MSLKLRLKTSISLIVIVFSTLFAAPTSGVQKPEVNYLRLSNLEFETTSSNMNLEIELSVSHSAGIFEQSTNFVFGKDSKFSITSTLSRTDKPNQVNQSTVVFKGTIEIPRTFPSGVYQYFAEGVTSNPSRGIGRISTGLIEGEKIRDIYGAEYGVLLRTSGYLDLNTTIINGPSYGIQTGRSYLNPGKYLGAPTPLWRVGEIIDLNNYFEITAKDITYQIVSNTPNICEAREKTLKLVNSGLCTYVIITPRTKNFSQNQISDTVVIENQRSTQELFVSKIPNQKPKSFPFSIKLDSVYASGISSAEYVYPISETKTVCESSLYNLTIYSGGICSLLYQSKGNDKFLPSEKYYQKFEITKLDQELVFELPKTVSMTAKNIPLVAKLSTSRIVQFKSLTRDICEVNLGSLKLIKPGLCRVEAFNMGDSNFIEAASRAEIQILKKQRKTRTNR